MDNQLPAMFSFMCIGFFAIIFLGLGILMVVMNRKNQKRADASTTWPSTQGRIIQAEVHEGESVLDEFGQSKTIFYPKVKYEYQAQGIMHTGQKLSFGGSETFANYQDAKGRIAALTPGSLVHVYYDPSNPDNAVLDRIAKKSSYVIILGSFFIALGLCVLLSILVMIITRIMANQ